MKTIHDDWYEEQQATSPAARNQIIKEREENNRTDIPKTQNTVYNGGNKAGTSSTAQRTTTVENDPILQAKKIADNELNYEFKLGFWRDKPDKVKEIENEYKNKKNALHTELTKPKLNNLSYTGPKSPSDAKSPYLARVGDTSAKMQKLPYTGEPGELQKLPGGGEKPELTFYGSSKVNPGSYTGPSGIPGATSPFTPKTNEHTQKAAKTNHNSEDNANTLPPAMQGLTMKFEDGSYAAQHKKDHETKLSVRDAAEMAKRSYNNYAKKEDGTFEADLESRKVGDGWVLVDTYEKNGLEIHIYSRGDSEDSSYQGPKEYVVVNRGSNSLGDWVDNALQPIGGSADMHESIDYVKKFVQRAEHDGYKVTFVGHSKGGAEAAANAIATNKHAIIFNPAELSRVNYRPDEWYTGDITSYVTPGDPLNALNEVVFKHGDDYKTRYLPPRKPQLPHNLKELWDEILKYHDIGTAVELIDKEESMSPEERKN